MLSIKDNDKIISIEETLGVYKKLKISRLLVLPNTLHSFESISADRIAFEIINFFNT